MLAPHPGGAETGCSVVRSTSGLFLPQSRVRPNTTKVVLAVSECRVNSTLRLGVRNAEQLIVVCKTNVMIMRPELPGTSRMIIRVSGDWRLKYASSDVHSKVRRLMRRRCRSSEVTVADPGGARQLFILELPERFAAVEWVAARREAAAECPNAPASVRHETLLERLSALWRCTMKRLASCG